jgi:hypothetical protein
VGSAAAAPDHTSQKADVSPVLLLRVSAAAVSHQQFFYGAEAETDRAKVKAADYDAKNPAGSYTFVFKH